MLKIQGSLLGEQIITEQGWGRKNLYPEIKHKNKAGDKCVVRIKGQQAWIDKRLQFSPTMYYLMTLESDGGYPPNVMLEEIERKKSGRHWRQVFNEMKAKCDEQ